MRAFAFQPGEITDSTVRAMIVDLDSIVTFIVTTSVSPPPLRWWVNFSDGKGVSLTEPAFDRILRAWRSGRVAT